MKIDLKIVTPERSVFEDRIDQATLPVLDGEITILPNHRSYIAALKSGEIVLKKDGKENNLSISSGFVEFNKNTLIILADTAERADEIDLKRAKEGKKRAEEAMRRKITMDESEYALVAATIEKETARIKVAKKHHFKHRININS